MWYVIYFGEVLGGPYRSLTTAYRKAMKESTSLKRMRNIYLLDANTQTVLKIDNHT